MLIKKLASFRQRKNCSEKGKIESEKKVAELVKRMEVDETEKKKQLENMRRSLFLLLYIYIPLV
jgi:hypothetical protein